MIGAAGIAAGEKHLERTISATAKARATNSTRPTLAGVTVESRLSVSVDGNFESLREVVAYLCAESGIVLRSYAAPDREVVAHYEGISLRETLERLLSQESFVLGFKKKPGYSRAKITWLRVIASKTNDSRPPGAARASVALPRAAFVGSNVLARRRATQSFARSLEADPGLRNRLLATTDGALLVQLRGHSRAAEFLDDLATQIRHPRLRSKIVRLRAQLPGSR